jgi:Ribonuclease G/E
MLIIFFKIFRSYIQNKGLSEILESKYYVALDLQPEMCSYLPEKRPNCEKILEDKNKWALNEEEFEIDDKLYKELIIKLFNKN